MHSSTHNRKHACHTQALEHAHVSKRTRTPEYLSMYMRSTHAINTRAQSMNTLICVHTGE